MEDKTFGRATNFGGTTLLTVYSHSLTPKAFQWNIYVECIFKVGLSKSAMTISENCTFATSLVIGSCQYVNYTLIKKLEHKRWHWTCLLTVSLLWTFKWKSFILSQALLRLRASCRSNSLQICSLITMQTPHLPRMVYLFTLLPDSSSWFLWYV